MRWKKKEEQRAEGKYECIILREVFMIMDPSRTASCTPPVSLP
jgi:hypothetical protein